MRSFGLNLLGAISFLSSESFVRSDDCSTLSHPILQSADGNVDNFPYDDSMVTITAQNINEVNFSVSQTWNTDGLPMVAVHYFTVDGESLCSMESMENGLMIPFGDKKHLIATCIDGYAEVSVYAYVDTPKERPT
jgi:hypothetical protein